MATLSDIARRAGVSTATVSRVINRSPLVTAETTASVEAAIRELNYQPSHAARALARQQTDTIGVIFPTAESGFYAEILSAMDHEAGFYNNVLMTAFARGDDHGATLLVNMLSGRRTDGIIVMNVKLSPHVLDQLTRRQVPLVVLDRPCEQPFIDSLSIDNQTGIRLALEHLVNTCGHRRFAVLTGPSGTYDADQRLRCFREQAPALGLDPAAAGFWAGDFTERGGYRAVRHALTEGAPQPDVILSFNDAMAFGAHLALRELGLRVPEDVALMGFDNIAMSRYFGLTTISVPLEELGRIAIRRVLRREDPPEHGHQVLPTSLVVRSTCGASPPSLRDVSRSALNQPGETS